MGIRKAFRCTRPFSNQTLKKGHVSKFTSFFQLYPMIQLINRNFLLLLQTLDQPREKSWRAMYPLHAQDWNPVLLPKVSAPQFVPRGPFSPLWSQHKGSDFAAAPAVTAAASLRSFLIPSFIQQHLQLCCPDPSHYV